ncbi:MAG: hypothetical protein ABIQ15_01215 [Nocardioides sp.]
MLEQPDNTTRDKATQGIPTWVKGFVIAAVVLVVLVVVVLLTGGHGPGRHTQNGSPEPAAGQSTHTKLVSA